MKNISKLITGGVVAATMLAATVANAAEIGFVNNNGTIDRPFDEGWINRLTDQGHNVTLWAQGTDAADPGLAAMDLFIVSSRVGSGDFIGGIGLYQSQSYITYEPAVYDEIFGASNGNGDGTQPLTIVDHTHYLAQAMNGTVNIYDGGGTVPFANLPASSGTTVIGTTGGAGTLMTLEAGAQGGLGTFPSLWIAVPVDDDWDPALVTEAGWKILDAAVAYAMVPEPSSFALIGLGLAAFFARRRR